MNTGKLSVLIFVTSFGFSVGSAQGDSARNGSDEPVTIEFTDLSDYTDFGSSYQPTEADMKALAEEFRDEFIPMASRYVPEGHHLSLRFLDIDMAGDFEPHRGAELADVRILRSIYPPRLTVEYRVIGPSGEVVSSGRRAVNDLSYQNVVTFRRDERLFYETELALQLVREIMRTV